MLLRQNQFVVRQGLIVVRKNLQLEPVKELCQEFVKKKKKKKSGIDIGLYGDSI